jgi:hypothetical protein
MDKCDAYPGLDDLAPPASEVIGLQFGAADEFARCQALLWRHLDCYRSINKWDRFVVVRKDDLHLFRDAALTYTEIELVEPSENPGEEERAAHRAAMKRYMSLWLQELEQNKRAE